MSQGKQHTFISLLEDVDVIEIPVIQRDYAQGRAQARDVREDFLAALFRALVNGGCALDLDFIYGSVLDEGLRTLSVLDGQQRLTTLFLLHWYLGALDHELDHFRECWTVPNDGRSRFTYSTRPHAGEFFQALTERNFEMPALGNGITPSSTVIDSRWFFDAWGGDPTVRSCLAMIDAIHQKFGSQKGLYRALVEQRKVTFHYLDLRDFGLSDDLYIKMNARGKGLTPFENFKAWIIERIKTESWASAFAAALDQKWLDFFWTLSGRDGQESFDDLFLRFFYLEAYFDACRKQEAYWHSAPAARNWVQRLRDARGALPLKDLETNNCFDAIELAQVHVDLDYLCGDDGGFVARTVTAALMPRADYNDLLRLYAILAFGRSARTLLLDRSDRDVAFQRWRRVTSNLISNSRIDDLGSAAAAVRGLTTLASHIDKLYETLAGESITGLGFARDQIEEECKKASLILVDAKWEGALIAAESHWYLQGRVRFLMDISTDAAGQIDRIKFRRYTALTKATLTREVLESSQYLLQRALLSLYDFLPWAGGGNRTFCLPNATAYRDRLENWLPVFEDPQFKQLLDAIGENPILSLEELINTSRASDWRRLFVSDPGLFGYCGARLIRTHGPSVFLMSKVRLTGYFAEAYSYALFRELCRRRESGKLLGATYVDYQFVYGDAYPNSYSAYGRKLCAFLCQ